MRPGPNLHAVPRATARTTLTALAFEDDPRSRNPTRRPVEWRHDFQGDVQNARTEPLDVDPGATVSLWSTALSLTADASTSYNLSAPSGAPALVYRLAWAGSGAAPGFRTRRSVALAGRTATLTVQADNTVVVTLDSTTPFGAVQVGDQALIPGTSTYDAAGPFSALNEGYWVVLAASAATVTLARISGAVFSAVTESVVVASDAQLRFFSAAGARAGDSVQVLSAFPSSVTRTYTVTAAADDRVEFQSPVQLPALAGTVPGASAVQVYRGARSWVAVMTDQEIAIQVNGDTSERMILLPVVPGDPDRTGLFALNGPVFSLSVKNRSSAVAGVRVTSWQ